MSLPNPIYNQGVYTDANGQEQYGVDPVALEAWYAQEVAAGRGGPGGSSTTQPRTPRFPDVNLNDPVNDYYTNLYKDANKPLDEAGIRAARLKEVQAQLDSLNSIYDNMVGQLRIEGENRSGQTRAVGSRRGLVGSEMGDAQKIQTEQYNEKVIAAKNEERAAALAAVRDKAIARANDEILQKTAQKKLDAANYIEYIKGKQDETKTDIKDLAATGIKIEDVDNETYKALLESSGFKSEAELDAYFNRNKPKAEQVKYEYKELKDGSILRYGDDGSYKTLDDIKIPQEGDWAVQELDDGTVIAYDRNKVNSEGKFTYEKIGNFAKPKAGSNTSNYTKFTSSIRSQLQSMFNAEEIKQLEEAVNEQGWTTVANNPNLSSDERSLLKKILASTSKNKSIDTLNTNDTESGTPLQNELNAVLNRARTLTQGESSGSIDWNSF